MPMVKRTVAQTALSAAIPVAMAYGMGCMVLPSAACFAGIGVYRIAEEDEQYHRRNHGQQRRDDYNTRQACEHKTA